MRLGVIVPHKTEVAIALWRISPGAAMHRGFFLLFSENNQQNV